MPKILENIDEDNSLDIEIAFGRCGRDSIAAVDYCVFDPYHNYTPAGYQEWGFEKYDEDEEVEDEEHLPVSWEEMYIEEKEHLVRVLNETFNFCECGNAEKAASNVRMDYENNPESWNVTEVDDLDGFEEDLTEIIDELYFFELNTPGLVQDIELSALDEVEASAVCISEGQTAPHRFIILDTDYCIGDDGCKYQLADRSDARRVIESENYSGAPKIICRVSDDNYTITDVNGNEREFDGLYINYAEDGKYRALKISGVDVYEALKNFKNDTVPHGKLEDIDHHYADEQGNIVGLKMVASDNYDGDCSGEELFELMYERLYSTNLPELRDINRCEELEKIAMLLGYEHVCCIDGDGADICFYVKDKECKATGPIWFLEDKDVKIINPGPEFEDEVRYNGKCGDCDEWETWPCDFIKDENLSKEYDEHGVDNEFELASRMGYKYAYKQEYWNEIANCYDYCYYYFPSQRYYNHGV